MILVQIATALAIGAYVVLSKDTRHERINAGPTREGATITGRGRRAAVTAETNPDNLAARVRDVFRPRRARCEI
jgi:hypothetical protein